MPLALWVARHHTNDDDAAHEAYNAEWSLLSFTGSDNDDLPSDLDAVFEFQIDESTAFLQIRDGRAAVTAAVASEKPSDVTICVGVATIAAIAAGRITLGGAVAQGHLEARGTPPQSPPSSAS